MDVRRLKIKQPEQKKQPATKPEKVWKVVRKILRVWLWAFTTVAFMLFICEESTQLLGFSRMNYRNVQTIESYKAWAVACERDTKVVNACRIAAGATWIINPISSVTFAMYFDQEKVKLNREIWVANRLLAELEGKEEAKHARDKEGAKLEASFPTVVQAGPGTTPTQKPVILSNMFVYTTRTGKTYHKPSCYHLYKDGKPKTGIQQYTKATALSAGFSPCVRCKPGRN